MQLILMRNIERLGVIGDIVQVADGYARNWLLPQKYAVKATEENIRQLEQHKRKLLALEKETLQTMQALGAEVAKQSITIRARANEEDHLFGSVGAKEIADAFVAEGIEIKPRMVILEEPIKELGYFMVTIRLHSEVEVATKIWVVGEDRSSEEKIKEQIDEELVAESIENETEAEADEAIKPPEEAPSEASSES